MKSRATTVEEYLDQLPADRRDAIETVRDFVNDHLPDGYVETMAYGMITWVIPLERYPTTYNKQPLGYVALASQKNYMSLYLMSAYGEEDDGLRADYATTGKKLDMGKSCLRFRSLDDLALEPIAASIERYPVDAFIERYEDARA